MIWRDGEALECGPSLRPTGASWGAFTTVGCVAGRPLLWDRHLARLATTLCQLAASEGLQLPSEADVISLLAASGVTGPGRLRVVAREVDDGSGWTVEAAAAPQPGGGPDAVPLALAVRRWPAAPPLVGHKTLARLAWDLARREAVSAGADDALLVDAEGRVLETAIANVLVVVQGRVVTPPALERCLPGILRGWLLETLPAAGREVEVRDLQLAELLEADEIWATNAVQGVRRVGRVGTRTWAEWPVFETLAAIGVPAPGW